MEISPKINNLYREKCIRDWKWMQANCIGMTIYKAKQALEKELHTVSCWACTMANKMRPTARSEWFCEINCPVAWSESGEAGVGCTDRGSVYHDLCEFDDLLTVENTQKVIDTITNTWEIQ